MRIQQQIVGVCSAAVVLGIGLVSVARADSIPLSVSYSSYSSPTDPTHPDFYIYSLNFTLPSNFTNAALNFTTLHLDDRGVVQLNGTIVTSSGITNGLGLNGQMILTAGGPVESFIFAHDYFDTTFAPITTGFVAGLNTIDIIVNDTSGGLNFRQGLLSGGYFWYTGFCFGCNFSEVRNGITYYRGDINPATGAEFAATVTYDVNAAVGETPIPGALPLFATGLAGLGFFAHRRKRRRA